MGIFTYSDKISEHTWLGLCTQDGSSPVMNGGNAGGNYRRQMAPKNAVHSAAVKLAIPLSEREERINYLDEYSCKPPPLFLICISLAQVTSPAMHFFPSTFSPH